MVTFQIHNPLFSDATLQRRLINFLTIHNLCIRASWNISVRGSIVFLRGRVDDSRSLARLETSCRRVAGVIGVDSSAVSIGRVQSNRARSAAMRRVRQETVVMFEQLSIELSAARGDLSAGRTEMALPADLTWADPLWRSAPLDDEEGTMSQSLLLVLAGLSPEAQQNVLDGLADRGLVVKPAEFVAGSATDPTGQLVSQVEERLRRLLRDHSVRADTYVVQSEPSAESEPVLKFPLLTIALESREVFIRGRLVPLSRTEFNLLRLMAKSPGRVLSREDLVVRSRGSDYPVTSRSIDVQIVGIRKKLGPARSYIETVRGAGYRFFVADPK